MSQDNVQMSTIMCGDEPTAAPKKTAFPTLSKTKYQKFLQLLEEIVPEHKDKINQGLCDILNYDPSLPRSTPERYASTMACIKRKAEKLGTTTYVTGGRQKSYQRKQEQRAIEIAA